MFSSNEKYEEIPTEHLQYLLLPYFLGDLAMKLTTGDRCEIVDMADVYFKDFLQRCDEYGFEDASQIKSIQSRKPDGTIAEIPDKMAQLLEMAEDRNTKLRKYREKKELDDEIKRLKLVMTRDQDDEGVKRDFYVKLIKSSILDSFDEIKCLATEKQMLDHMKKMRLENLEHERPKKFTPKPLKPIIITRDAAQKAVYGLGYPSFPTMTVAEFYDKRVADGIFPDPTQDNSLQSRANQMTDEEKDEQEKIEREQMEENDNEQLRQRNRAMDDWKDEHRRGEGNRHNRS